MTRLSGTPAGEACQALHPKGCTLRKDECDPANAAGRL
jgi:hypothetical protein